jgi:phosphatidylinositol glycan class A protein
MFPKHAAIMAKKSIRLIPGLGWFMLLSGTVFIDRGNAKSAISSMDQAGADMKRKRVSAAYILSGDLDMQNGG